MNSFTYVLFGTSLLLTPLIVLGENNNSTYFSSGPEKNSGKSAINSCISTVRERLPHPNTVKFLTTKATYTQSDPSSVQVMGRASFQKDVGKFEDADFQCAVEKNRIVDILITPLNTKKYSTPDKLVQSVSEQQAMKIMLDAYPGPLKNAQTFGPYESTLQSNIQGFAKINDKVWYLGIKCNNTKTSATFFVHPHTAKLFYLGGPGDKLPILCD